MAAGDTAAYMPGSGTENRDTVAACGAYPHPGTFKDNWPRWAVNGIWV